jgi:DNA-binding LytR/AlgR family response regulator
MNIFICDDSAEQTSLCKKTLLHLSARHGIHVKIRTFPSGEALLFEVEDAFSALDLIYLDIRMPGLNGLETATRLREIGYLADIVFFTVSPDYAIAGYDVSALHYVVKSQTSAEKFEEIFLRACERKQRRESEVLVLTCAGESRCVPLEEIRYFEIQQRIVTVVYGNERFEFYSTMMRLEEQLFNKGFVRTHKSFLVSKRFIHSIDSSRVLLDTGETLPVGKRYYADSLASIGVAS